MNDAKSARTEENNGSDAGMHVVKSPADIGSAMKEALAAWIER